MREICRLRPFRWFAGGAVALASVGFFTACASGSPDPTAPRGSPAVTEYVMVQPEATGLLEAADDGVHTYLEFSVIVPSELHVFTGRGERLESAGSGSLLGVPGLHEGLLLRLGTATSFVSVRPGSPRGAAALGDSRELSDVRQALRTRTPEYQAMRRAIERVAEREAGATPRSRDGESPARAPMSAPVAPTDRESPRGRLLAPISTLLVRPRDPPIPEGTP